MKIKNIVNSAGDNLTKKLFPLLLGKVFHTTSESAFKKIQESGFINSNKDNAYPPNFPRSRKNFGTQNGMVCLTDLRQKTYSETKEHFYDGYYFLRPNSDWKVVVFLLLDNAFHNDLKLQARFNPPRIGENYIPMEEVCKGTYVPTECWYPEKIGLDKISQALVVDIHDTPSTKNSHSELLKKLESDPSQTQ